MTDPDPCDEPYPYDLLDGYPARRCMKPQDHPDPNHLIILDSLEWPVKEPTCDCGEVESLRETADILSDPEVMAAIREGEDAIARGDVYTLDEVMARAEWRDRIAEALRPYLKADHGARQDASRAVMAAVVGSLLVDRDHWRVAYRGLEIIEKALRERIRELDAQSVNRSHQQLCDDIDEIACELREAQAENAALRAEVERLRQVEREHTDDCGRFVECGTDGRTCDHAVTLVDNENTTPCVWCRIERIEEERDAYGDTLANIANRTDVAEEAASLIAKMTLDARGYLPWGRARRAEADYADLRARIDAALALCDLGNYSDERMYKGPSTYKEATVYAADIRRALTADSEPAEVKRVLLHAVLDEAAAAGFFDEDAADGGPAETGEA